MSDSNEKGYYILNEYPSELKTDQSYTYQLTTSPDGDMTDVTYSFGWKFTCDGIITEKTVASGLTDLTYIWTPSNVIFGPLMTKSKSGILNIVITTSTGKSTYVSKDIKLTIADSVRPSISNCTIYRTAYAYNDKSISNRTTHKLSLGVSGLYGASQTIAVSIGDAVNTIKVDAQPNNQISTVSLELGSFDAGTADSIEKTINIIVTDSRGFTVNSTTSVTIYGYTPPTLIATVYRDTNQDAYISFSTNHQNMVAGKANNINEFYAKCTTGSTTIQTDLKTSPQKLNGTDALENSYDVFVLLTDDVGGKDAKRFVIPNGTPVMDIGADGKTVSFFGTAPESADKLSLKIKDIASFGEEIRLGKTDGNQTLIGDSGMTMYNGSDEILHFGTIRDEDTYTRYYTLGTRTQGKQRGDYSFTAGCGLIASASYQTVVGKYNKDDDIAHLFVVGDGFDDANRSNVFEVEYGGADINGSLWINDPDGTMDGGLVLGISQYGNGEIIFSTKSDPNDIGKIGADSDGNIVISSYKWSDGGMRNSSHYTFSPNGAFSINGRDICENKVLWSGAWYMTNEHTAYLDESISDQPNGIVLVFSAYRGSNAENYHWCTFFVPKYLVSYQDRGFNCPLINTEFTNVACKYIYISDSQVTGNDNNASHGSASGISYNNRYYVMRYVIGV